MAHVVQYASQAVSYTHLDVYKRQANALGLYEDDNEKQDFELDEAADREDGARNNANSGVQGYTLFEKNTNGEAPVHPDGSSTSQKSE